MFSDSVFKISTVIFPTNKDEVRIQLRTKNKFSITESVCDNFNKY